MRLPALRSLAAFVAVAESGQFRSAARRLDLTESAVSHQMSRLEADLGLRLFARGPGGAALTRGGTELYQRLRGPLRELEHIMSDYIGGRATMVRMTMPQSLASMWYSPRLHELAADHPGIDVHLIATDRICDLNSEQIDLAIRYYGAEPPQAQQASLLGQEKIFPVISPANAGKFAALGFEGFVAAHGALLNALHPDEWQIWCRACGFSLPPRSLKTLPSFDLVANATANGFGIAMGRTPMINAMLEDGRLVRPSGVKALPAGWYCLVNGESRPFAAAPRKIAEWLRRRFAT